MIAFCTTCKGRTQHLRLTLPKNLDDNKDFKDLKFVILDYNSPDDLLDYLWSGYADLIRSGCIVIYSAEVNGAFHMAHAKNMVHRLGIIEGADVLVNLDADNYTGPGFARYVDDQFNECGTDTFLWAQMFRQLGGRRPRGISGRIVVSDKAFINSGGYDEAYAQWGHDDKDFNTRLRRLGYHGREIPQCYLDAVLHNDKMRFKDYPDAKEKTTEGESDTVNFSEATVVNFGNVGCGAVKRNFEPGGRETVPIRMLTPIPTRIFGIGMHKTATTSLNAALHVLGIDSAHWKSAHWAKAIWEEMQTWHHSLTLEKHYAACDLPITILYAQLDKAYPGSKFILTVRDEDRWLQSVRNHWDAALNPFRGAWNTDPFTHRVHKLLYGQKGFNAEIFIARYRKHNADVLEYFKGRPDDLLVMEMDDGAGWKELCGFLGKPIPNARYPKAFVTSE